MPRLLLPKEDPYHSCCVRQASGCETHRLHEVLHGNHDVFKDVFMRVPIWLESLEEELCLS
jgi:hypothetical protein